MVALRVLDYRYRLESAPRPRRASSALRAIRRPRRRQGYYDGAGLQWRDLWPHWDLSLDLRDLRSSAAQQVLPSDPQNGDPVEWYTMQAPTLYLSRRF